tara:strand:+ start:2178 stop:3623 length:1446 start_codon:yes stop_codon:yes gene_type:complete
MLKIITPSSWQYDEPIAQLVKVSSRGLQGADLSLFIKRAGHRFADKLQDIKLEPGEVPVHLIAIGSTEYYGPNRNGDGFKEASCKKYHDTFVKSARWYRNHKNKNPEKSFGIVKASHYNPEMKRIELLVTLNSTKEAADRNGGLVADEEMQKLANGDDIAVSMACRVPFDVCSGCGNKARNRNEYCDGALCKYGGLTTKIGTVLEDGHILHADNPDPTFFDISKVFRPADRIAYTMGRLEKAAAAGTVLSGAELAESMQLTMPHSMAIASDLPASVIAQIKIAQKLVDAENEAPNWSHKAAAFSQELRGNAGIPDMRFVTTTKVAQMTRALAEQGIVLPVEEFLVMVHGDAEKAASVATQVRNHLPGVYSRMFADGSFETTAQSNPYLSSDNTHMGEFRKVAAHLAADYSLKEEYVERRLRKAVLRNVSPRNSVLTKVASFEGPGEELARQYALYKVAAFKQMEPHVGDLSLTLTLSILQN